MTTNQITRLCNGCGCSARASKLLRGDWLVCCGDEWCIDSSYGKTKEEAIANWNNKEGTHEYAH